MRTVVLREYLKARLVAERLVCWLWIGELPGCHGPDEMLIIGFEICLQEGVSKLNGDILAGSLSKIKSMC